MRRTRGRVIEVETVEELDRRVASGASRLDGWRVNGVDLTARSDMLGAVEVDGATFLGCAFAPGDEAAVEARGALVLPRLGAVPVNRYADSLYSPDDLYDRTPYRSSRDARTYAWSRADTDDDALLARALHDHSVDRALDDWVSGRHLVGVMGDHAVARGDAAYAEAARLGHAVGSRLTVATGGGPGAMEAANLGAYLSGHPVEALDQALATLAAAPGFRPSVDRWVASAREVLAEVPAGADSLGIPTWHYGHEPPNLFATTIAKYFRNALREAVLLQVCEAGIVFLPGAAGTVQEVFQDACENYYADETSLAPMVLVGARYWSETVPVWPLLTSLARGRPMEPHLHLVDSVDEAVSLLEPPP